jgi:hypothetical protein
MAVESRANHDCRDGEKSLLTLTSAIDPRNVTSKALSSIRIALAPDLKSDAAKVFAQL